MHRSMTQTLPDHRLQHVRWLQLVVVALLIAIVAVGARAVFVQPTSGTTAPTISVDRDHPHQAARSQPGASDRGATGVRRIRMNRIVLSAVAITAFIGVGSSATGASAASQRHDAYYQVWCYTPEGG